VISGSGVIRAEAETQFLFFGWAAAFAGVMMK
jgi:hypothetical protein